MPNFKTHCFLSKLRTEKNYAELHKWIDIDKEKGSDHRQTNHYYSKELRDYIINKWDKKAAVEWLFHIAIDNLQTAFLISKDNDCYGESAYNYFKFGLFQNKFVLCDCDSIAENDLKEIFDYEKHVRDDFDFDLDDEDWPDENAPIEEHRNFVKKLFDNDRDIDVCENCKNMIDKLLDNYCSKCGKKIPK